MCGGWPGTKGGDACRRSTHRATEVAVTGKVKVEVDSLIKLVDAIGRGKLNSERL